MTLRGFVVGVGFPLYTEFFLHYYTMVLQRIRIIVGDTGFEPGTSANELPMSHLISNEG